MEVPSLHGSVEEQTKPTSTTFASDVNAKGFDFNAKAYVSVNIVSEAGLLILTFRSSLGPSYINMSFDGNSDPEGNAETTDISMDIVPNGTAAVMPKANGLTGSALHQISSGQTDGSFDTSMIGSSQPNDLPLASSAPSSSSLMDTTTHQSFSLEHHANSHLSNHNTADAPLSGMDDGDDSPLGDLNESLNSPNVADESMNVSEPAPDYQDNSESSHMPRDDDQTSHTLLPSLELPHHPATMLNDTAPAAEGKSSTQNEGTRLLKDSVMRDAPKSPGKVAREREDEAEEEPAAKRSRTGAGNSQAAQFKVPELPQSAVEHNSPLPSAATQINGVSPVKIETPPGLDLSQSLTKAQHKFLLKAMQNVRKTKDATAFNKPVDHVALNIPSYPDVIKRPMDLSTIESNLKDHKYVCAIDCVMDFELVIQNCITFNGPEHPVSQAAMKLKPSFEKHLANFPGQDGNDPSTEKKSKKAAVAPKVAPPRRESRSSLGGNARSPSTIAPQQTFALSPSGVPLIRRDSTAQDGRPKREIHPPAPRDLPYANQKPKKKKYQLELRFCQEVLGELKKAKYQSVSWPFAQPVDPVALNIPHYHNVIKKPMDLSTIDKKLAAGQYENAKEFEVDVRLMFNNCYKFNPEGNAIHRLGKDFEEIFTEKWADKKQYLEDHTAPSGPQTPGTSPEPQDDEEEEEDEPEDEITALQKQIAAMSKQVEMIQKKKASPPVPTKKPAKGAKAGKKESKKTTIAMPFKSEKKSGAKHTKKEKIPYVTYEQKQDISNRINNLPAPRMATALTIIRDNMPNLKVNWADTFAFLS